MGKTLSKTQRKLLYDLLHDWDVCISVTMDGRCWQQHDGCGRGGDTRTVRCTTVFSLLDKGLIEVVQRRFPTTKLRLTLDGQRIARTIKLP